MPTVSNIQYNLQHIHNASVTGRTESNYYQQGVILIKDVKIQYFGINTRNMGNGYYPYPTSFDYAPSIFTGWSNNINNGSWTNDIDPQRYSWKSEDVELPVASIRIGTVTNTTIYAYTNSSFESEMNYNYYILAIGI